MLSDGGGQGVVAMIRFPTPISFLAIAFLSEAIHGRKVCTRATLDRIHDIEHTCKRDGQWCMEGLEEKGQVLADGALFIPTPPPMATLGAKKSVKKKRKNQADLLLMIFLIQHEMFVTHVYFLVQLLKKICSFGDIALPLLQIPSIACLIKNTK